MSHGRCYLNVVNTNSEYREIRLEAIVRRNMERNFVMYCTF